MAEVDLLAAARMVQAVVTGERPRLQASSMAELAGKVVAMPTLPPLVEIDEVSFYAIRHHVDTGFGWAKNPCVWGIPVIVR